MKSLRLFLVRHGNTFEKNQDPVMIGSQTDLNLTARGLEQADSVAKYFLQSDVKIDALYAGNIKRQQQAAQIIQSSQPSLNLLSHHCLNEIDYGKWEGLTVETVNETWSEQYSNWVNKATWPKDVFLGCEQDKKESIQQWLEELSTQRAGQTVVALTSQGVIKLIVSLYPSLWKPYKTLESFKVSTGNICELEISHAIDIKYWNQEPGRLTLEKA